MNLFVLYGHLPLMMDAVSATIFEDGWAIRRKYELYLVQLN
jgi:hypothetical protein